MSWFVRYWIVENDQEVWFEEGPFDEYFADLVLQDVGVDGTVPRGLTRVRVFRASKVPA